MFLSRFRLRRDQIKYTLQTLWMDSARGLETADGWALFPLPDSCSYGDLRMGSLTVVFAGA